MSFSLRALALLPALFAAPATAQDSLAIEEVRAAWQACTEVLERAPDEWVGWRRNFDGGYADHFEFHEGYDTPSVLVQTWMIDAIAMQEDTSCYRPDGSLAFIFSTMTSPNMAIGEASPSITREGRIYYAPDGTVLRILGRIVENGVEVAKTDNDQYALARGCDLTQPHLNLDDVRIHMASVLGDIEGNRPPFDANYFAWCNDEMLNK